MAQDTNLGVGRARESEQAMDEDSTRARLQRHMAETREAIDETYREVKETVADQYRTIRTTAEETLDWREQMRKHPVAVTLGALGIGAVTGYALAALISRDYEEDVRRDIDVSSPTSAFPDHHSYASQPITGDVHSEGPAPHSSETPGYVERFKESPVYERAKSEATQLGTRLLDELASTFRTHVVPLLIVKLRDIIAAGVSPKRAETDQLQTRSTTTERAKSEQPIGGSAPGKTDTSTSNSRYDDRYERESRLFNKGEPRGADLKFDAGRKAEE